MTVSKHVVHEGEKVVSHLRLFLKVTLERYETLQRLWPVVWEPWAWAFEG